MSDPFKCAGCGIPWVGEGKHCDCPTGVLFRGAGETLQFDSKDKRMGMYPMFEDRENEVFDTLVTALKDVSNPLEHAQRSAEAEGCTLSGDAYRICNDLSYVQKIARDALASVLGERTHLETSHLSSKGADGG